MDTVKIGIVGCGNISGIYFSNAINLFSNLQVTACADIDLARAQARADNRVVASVPVLNSKSRSCADLRTEPGAPASLTSHTPQLIIEPWGCTAWPSFL